MDEFRFSLAGPHEYARVWRHCDQQCAPCNVVQMSNFLDSSVIVWGGISYDVRTDHFFLTLAP